jgi:hypothetical protein
LPTAHSRRGQSARRFPSYPPPPRDVCLRPDALRLPQFKKPEFKI